MTSCHTPISDIKVLSQMNGHTIKIFSCKLKLKQNFYLCNIILYKVILHAHFHKLFEVDHP